MSELIMSKLMHVGTHLVVSRYVGTHRVVMRSKWLKRLTVTEWRRATECLIYIGHFPQKSHIIGGSFAKNDVRWSTMALWKEHIVP